MATIGDVGIIILWHVNPLLVGDSDIDDCTRTLLGNDPQTATEEWCFLNGLLININTATEECYILCCS
jgi:hypothetical protein